MKKIDTHGLNINMESLKKCSENTRWLPQYCGVHDVIVYDMEEGDVWVSTRIGNDIVIYNSPSIIAVGETRKHLSQQKIADLVNEAVQEYKRYNH